MGERNLWDAEEEMGGQWLLILHLSQQTVVGWRWPQSGTHFFICSTFALPVSASVNSIYIYGQSLITSHSSQEKEDILPTPGNFYCLGNRIWELSQEALDSVNTDKSNQSRVMRVWLKDAMWYLTEATG